jgi:tRNA modification GTPase
LSGGIIIKASVLHGTGLQQLEDEIEKLFVKGSININSEVLVTNIRHKNLLDKAIASLNDARTAFEGKMPLDFITIDIKNAAEYLGQITGESVSEDIVREIFSRFCVGK